MLSLQETNHNSYIDSGWHRPPAQRPQTILAPVSAGCSLQKLFHYLEEQASATAVHLILLQIQPPYRPVPDEATLYSQMKALHGQMQHLPVTFEIRTLSGSLPETITIFAQRREVHQILLCGETAVHAAELKTKLIDQMIIT